MKSFFISTLSFLLITILSLKTWAQRVTIFEVRKDLRLSDSEPVFKDYYINAGFAEGLKPGVVLDVVRRIPIHDSLKNQAQGDLSLVIAKIRLLHVQKNLSVARLYSPTSVRQRPIADFNSIMIGDELDLSSAMVPVKVKEEVASFDLPAVESHKLETKAEEKKMAPRLPAKDESGVSAKSLSPDSQLPQATHAKTDDAGGVTSKASDAPVDPQVPVLR